MTTFPHSNNSSTRRHDVYWDQLPNAKGFQIARQLSITFFSRKKCKMQQCKMEITSLM